MSKKKKKQRSPRKYPLYTRKERKRTDLKYLVRYMIARTSESRLALAYLPLVAADQREQVMRSVLARLAAGNCEVERLYRLLTEQEPYIVPDWVDGKWITVRIPESPEIEAARQELEAAIPDFVLW